MIACKSVTKNNLELLKNIEALKVADINAKDSQGNTVLHYAAMKSNNTEILDFLISKGTLIFNIRVCF